MPKTQYPISSEQQEINEIFQHMEQAIRINTYEANDLMFMIADLIPANPVLAAAVANHAGDFIKSDDVTPDTTWTDIVVEAYRRALFDLVASPRYGTDYMVKNLEKMREFVNSYIRDHGMNVPGKLAPALAQ